MLFVPYMVSFYLIMKEESIPGGSTAPLLFSTHFTTFHNVSLDKPKKECGRSGGHYCISFSGLGYSCETIVSREELMIMTNITWNRRKKIIRKWELSDLSKYSCKNADACCKKQRMIKLCDATLVCFSDSDFVDEYELSNMQSKNGEISCEPDYFEPVYTALLGNAFPIIASNAYMDWYKKYQEFGKKLNGFVILDSFHFVFGKNETLVNSISLVK